MRVVAYNFAHRKKEQWSKIFADFSPDIILAQEARHPERDVPEIYKLNPNRFFWAPANNYWGSALFIKHGDIKRLDLPDFSGWVVGAEITNFGWLAGSMLRVFSLHVPSRKSNSYVKEMNLILDKIAELPDNGELIIGGDFNITAGFRHKNETRETGKGSEKVLTRLGKEFGLINCWQVANPDRPLAQTLRWGSDKTVPYHCDGIFVSAALRQHLNSCEVASMGWEELSDHNPVVATFKR